MRKQTYKTRRRSNNIKRKNRINMKALFLGIGSIAIIISLILGGIWAFKKITKPTKEIIEVEMGESILPIISIEEEGYSVNELLPYAKQMDVLTMRETISPLTPQGDLTLQIETEEEGIVQVNNDEISYQVLSIDGKNVLKEAVGTLDSENKTTLNLRSVLASGEEGILEIVVNMTANNELKKLFYYTRVTPYDESNLKQNLDFVQSTHTAIMEKDKEYLLPYFKNTFAKETGYYDEVTEESHVVDVMWGEVEPQIVGDIEWRIFESSSLFTSIELKYTMNMAQEDRGTEAYIVSEFFRVGYSTQIQGTQLRQYNRTIESIVTEEKIRAQLAESGEALSWENCKTNEENTAWAFGLKGAMYLYDVEQKELVSLYNPLQQANQETYIMKYRDVYDMRVLSIDEQQNVAFILYGYLNRGKLEGQVGTQVLYYDRVYNTVEEKAFIESDQSYVVGKTEMSAGLYYSNMQNKIYAIVQDSLYEVDMNENVQNKKATELQKNGYAYSDDGKYIAYIRNENVEKEYCEVLELESGEVYQIEHSLGEITYPLGFMEDDVLVGTAKMSDNLIDETGLEITPMYKLEIRDTDGNVVKTFNRENQYIRDIVVENNMITMNLLEKNESEYFYAGQDVITNNKKAEPVVMQGEVKLSEIKIKTAVLVENLDSVQIAYENKVKNTMYYAYAYGDLQVMSAMPSKAIQYASEHMGMVVNENQEYVWRSGSRNLRYTSTNTAEYASRMRNGESAIDIVAEISNQQVVSYTGCTVEQMCYLMNQGQMIAGKLKDDSWILLVGYNGTTITYLNSNGGKNTIEMYKLEEKLDELIGDGIF